MSFTEKHIGKLVKVDRKGLTVEEWCKEYCQSHFTEIDNKMYENWIECFRDNFYDICTDGIRFINGDIYQLVKHTKIDECEDLDFFYTLEDGSILFVTEFYNGGTCLEEVLENGVKRICKTKISNKEIIELDNSEYDYGHNVNHKEYYGG